MGENYANHTQLLYKIKICALSVFYSEKNIETLFRQF